MYRRIAALGSAAVTAAVIAGPAAAQAATISSPAQCVGGVATQLTAPLVGSGFTPGAPVTISANGVPFADAILRLEQLPSVPGRMQQVGDVPLVVIDYAHTPDALEKVLQALRPVAAQRGGKLRKTVRLARPSGDCGTFSVRARQIPIAHPHVGQWTVDFDQRHRYAGALPPVRDRLIITVRRIPRSH